MKTLFLQNEIKPWVVEATRLEQTLLNRGISCDVSIATRGGWRVGHRWSGGFKVVFYPKNFGRLDVSRHSIKKTFYSEKVGSFHDSKVFMGDYVAGRIENYYHKRVRIPLSLITDGQRVLELYRDCWLIPKRIARQHNEILKKLSAELKVNWPGSLYTSNKIINSAWALACRYLRRYAVCPKCGKRGFDIDIMGWHCYHNCGAVLEDYQDKYEWRF